MVPVVVARVPDDFHAVSGAVAAVDVDNEVGPDLLDPLLSRLEEKDLVCRRKSLCNLESFYGSPSYFA